MPAETGLLIALCRTPLTDAARQKANGLLALDLDWDALFDRALLWEVEPVVFVNLRLLDHKAVPRTAMQKAMERERESRATALSRTLIMMDLLKQFGREKIPVIVLKGPAVAVEAYGDPSLRTFGDMDFMVARSDLVAARELLLTMGYIRDYQPSVEASLIRDQHALEFTGTRAKVELHWTLLSRHLRLDFHVSDMWGASRKVACAGDQIIVLARHHAFLFLCAHGAKHEWSRRRWICDVAQLSSRLDENDVKKILELANRTHSKRILALGLRVARDLLAADDSPFDSKALVPESETIELIEGVSRHLDFLDSPRGFPARSVGPLARLDPGIAPLLFWTRARERRIDRVACMARVLLVPTEKDGTTGILRWVRRPARLAVRALGRSIAR